MLAQECSAGIERGYNWTPDDLKTAEVMHAFFVNFIKRATPTPPVYRNGIPYKAKAQKR